MVIEFAGAGLVALDFCLSALAGEYGDTRAEPVAVVEAATGYAETVCAVAEVTLPQPCEGIFGRWWGAG